MILIITFSNKRVLNKDQYRKSFNSFLYTSLKVSAICNLWFNSSSPALNFLFSTVTLLHICSISLIFFLISLLNFQHTDSSIKSFLSFLFDGLAPSPLSPPLNFSVILEAEVRHILGMNTDFMDVKRTAMLKDILTVSSMV